jgi:hypothetical protein
MTFPPEVMVEQLAADGVDIQAMRERYERIFPRHLDPVTPNDLLWFARFVVERRRYLRALDVVERRVYATRESGS